MAPHSSTLAWKIPWMEEPGRLQSMGLRRVRHDCATSLSLSLSCVGEGDGNLFQCSCLENPRDGGAWCAAIYGVAQSPTRLKWLSSSSKLHLHVIVMSFPVVVQGCENWTINKAERRKIDAFELWCWRRLLRVPWTARRSNQSTLKEISPEYSLEGLMLKLKLLYFGHLVRRVESLMLGKIEGRRRKGWQRMKQLDGITDSVDMNLSKLQEIKENIGAWCVAVHGIAESDMT